VTPPWRERALVALWLRWVKGRIRIARWVDPFDFTSKSQKEMALENAAESLSELDAPDFPDYPEPGDDFELVDVTPDVRDRLDARMEEVYVYHGRERVRRERRRQRTRRVAVLAATVVLVMSGATGASALIRGTTGIPAIDSLLAIQERGEHPRSNGASSGDFRGEKHTRKVILTLPGNQGNQKPLTASASLSESDRVCIALAHAYPDESRPAGNVSCLTPEYVAHELRERPLLIVSLDIDAKGAALTGFAREDVDTITGRGPTGEMRIRLAEPWHVANKGLAPVRALLAAPPPAPGGVSVELGERLRNSNSYVFRVRLTSGDILTARPQFGLTD